MDTRASGSLPGCPCPLTGFLTAREGLCYSPRTGDIPGHSLLIFLRNTVMGETQAHAVIVAGAGPAGMAVASALSKVGHEIIILNRDIKFGGLAEYGIFPSKLKLRGGLKKQYWELLQQKNVHYLGNVSIGNGKDLTVEDVRGLGASAVVFTIGAQGTKAIGVEGDSAQGVFHAKDVVYHFNRLPSNIYLKWVISIATNESK